MDQNRTDKKIKIHSVKYNLFMNMILKVSSFVFPLITLPYVSRTLLVKANGRVTFATSVIHYFTLFALLGIPTYGVRTCAKYRDDNAKLSKTVHELLIINAICTVIAYVIFGILIHVVPLFSENSLLLKVMSASIILSTMGVEWFYQAIEQYDYITVRNILFKILALVMMFLFVHTPSDYIIYGVITVVGTVGSNILNIIRLPKFITIKRFPHYDLKSHIKPTLLLFFYTAASAIYTNLDVIMLGFMRGEYDTGIYNASVKIKTMLVSAVTALGAVTLPRVSYYFQHKNHKEYKNLLHKSFNFVMLLSLPTVAFMLLECRNIILLLSGEEFIDAVPAMMVGSVSVIFIGIGSITAWQMLIPSGEDKVTIYGALIGAGVDLVINLLLIPQTGALGAAIGTTVAEVFVLLTHAYFLKSRIKDIADIRNNLKIVLSVIIAGAVMIVFRMLVPIQTVVIALLCYGTVFSAVYGLSLIFAKEDSIQWIVRKILHRKAKAE